MKALVLNAIGPVEDSRLHLEERPIPEPGPGEVLVRVAACGICHTELDEIEGRLAPRLPIVLGHQVVGRVDRTGPDACRFQTGTRVGVTWLYWACGRCAACLEGSENLCPHARWTGKDADGGYAEYMTVPEAFACVIPDGMADTAAAPLLCAGVIGYRALRLADVRPGQVLALYGFGASAHIVIQLIRHLSPTSPVLVVTRSERHRHLARRLGATWTVAPGDVLPAQPNRAIDFTPVGSTVRDALDALAPGGRLVVNAIRKQDVVPPLDYARHLWHEKEVKSVANVTRRDGEEFLPLAAAVPIVPEVQTFGFADVNRALVLLKQGAIDGAAVLVP